MRSPRQRRGAGNAADSRIRLTYVSYDGATDPLGESQILAYLERLAADFDITLLSFEKPGGDRADMALRLRQAGIRWLPLTYHKRPLVLSTAWDMARGTAVLLRETRCRRPAILHARSVVAAFIAAAGSRRGQLVFDMRAFWADERLEADPGLVLDVVYRGVRAIEHRLVRRADAIVTLTERSVPQIRAWTHDLSTPIVVIPTCADVERYMRSVPRPGGPHAVWVGSIGPRYRFDLAVALAQALDMPMTVLTRQVELARAALAGAAAEVRSVPPGMVWHELHEGDIGMCLYTDQFSRQATAPTRAAEHLAAGMPVAVTPGVGDLEALVENEGVGVVVRGEAAADLADAARCLRELAADPGTSERCRRVARERFSVTAGSAAYAQLWSRLVDRPVEDHE